MTKNAMFLVAAILGLNVLFWVRTEIRGRSARENFPPVDARAAAVIPDSQESAPPMNAASQGPQAKSPETPSSATPKSEPRVSAPAEIKSDPRGLRGWILTLSDDDLAKIAGTSTLDEYVVAALSDAGAQGSDEPGMSPEAIRFLGELSERILRAKSRN